MSIHFICQLFFPLMLFLLWGSPLYFFFRGGWCRVFAASQMMEKKKKTKNKKAPLKWVHMNKHHFGMLQAIFIIRPSTSFCICKLAWKWTLGETFGRGKACCKQPSYETQTRTQKYYFAQRKIQNFRHYSSAEAVSHGVNYMWTLRNGTSQWCLPTSLLN